MEEPEIYNCHIHIFTEKHAPRDFLKMYVPLVGAFFSLMLRNRSIVSVVVRFLSHVWPFSKNELLQRQVGFLTIGNKDTQAEILEIVKEYYPDGTRFVALPMDMEFMGLGPVRKPIDQQHAELLALTRASQGQLIPFFAVDPRRKERVVAHARQNLLSGDFKGVKLYPNLGYRPDDPYLRQVFEFCNEHALPVMSHCTDSGVWQYKLKPDDRRALSQPLNYEGVLHDYPNMRLCLAHCGGGGEWQKQLKGKDVKRHGPDRTWVRAILDMIRSGDYPNLYTDISFTLFSPKVPGLFVDLIDYLKVILMHPRVRERVLYGSDFYMVRLEKHSEKEIAIALRSQLGDDLFFQIAHHNPKRFLGIP